MTTDDWGINEMEHTTNGLSPSLLKFNEPSQHGTDGKISLQNETSLIKRNVSPANDQVRNRSVTDGMTQSTQRAVHANENGLALENPEAAGIRTGEKLTYRATDSPSINSQLCMVRLES